jgi:hypothetical protein
MIGNVFIFESSVKSTDSCGKWPKTQGFVKCFVQQSMNFQSIAISRPAV